MLNQLTLMGRLTRDLEMKTTTSGVSLAKGAIAVDTYAGKDRDGKAKKRTLFLDFVAFEGTAENIGKHFKKGDPILLVGELVLQTWEDKQTGTKRSKHEMNVRTFSFVLRAGAGDDAEPAPAPRGGDVPF